MQWFGVCKIRKIIDCANITSILSHKCITFFKNKTIVLFLEYSAEILIDQLLKLEDS